MKKLISIIIIVKNDPAVKDTVKHLLKYVENRKIEIIVVDSSTKPTLKNDKILIVPFKSNIIKKITIPEQRNVGIKKSSGNIIVFIDANCIPDKNWLEFLTLPIIDGKEKIVAGSIHSLTNDKRHDLRNELLSGREYLDEAPSMNLAVSRDVFDKIGMFDESFDYGSDVDFTKRAIEKGFKVKYQPKAILFHNWGNLKEELKRAVRYGEARVNIYKKRDIKWLDLFINDPITIIYPVILLLLPLSFIYPWYLLVFILLFIKNWNNYPGRTVLLNTAYGYGVLKKLSSNPNLWK